MKESDWDNLLGAIQDNNLELAYDLSWPTSGDKNIDNTPTEAFFYWSRNGKKPSEYGRGLTKDKLQYVIQRLESINIPVPSKFHEAYNEIKNK